MRPVIAFDVYCAWWSACFIFVPFFPKHFKTFPHPSSNVCVTVIDNVYLFCYQTSSNHNNMLDKSTQQCNSLFYWTLIPYLDLWGFTNPCYIYVTFPILNLLQLSTALAWYALPPLLNCQANANHQHDIFEHLRISMRHLRQCDIYVQGILDGTLHIQCWTVLVCHFEAIIRSTWKEVSANGGLQHRSNARLAARETGRAMQNADKCWALKLL